MANTIAPSAGQSPHQHTDPLLLTATAARLSNASLTHLRSTFGDVYTTLTEFIREFTDPRGHVTVGVTLNEDGSIDAVTDPEYHLLVDGTRISKTPAGIEQADVHLTFCVETFDTSMSAFRTELMTAVVQAVVLADQHVQTLPDEERHSYEQFLASHIDTYTIP